MDKQIVQSVLDELPDDVKMVDIIERLYLRIKVMQGLNDVKNNKLTTQEDLEKEMTEW